MPEFMGPAQPHPILLVSVPTTLLAVFQRVSPPQVVLRYDSGRGAVTALAVSPEGCFLAGGWIGCGKLIWSTCVCKAVHLGVLQPHCTPLALLSSAASILNPAPLAAPVSNKLTLQAQLRVAWCCLLRTPADASLRGSTWRPEAEALLPNRNDDLHTQAKLLASSCIAAACRSGVPVLFA